MTHGNAATICSEARQFSPGDKVQIKSQTGKGFPVYTVGELEQSPKENVLVVKVWYLNTVDGDIKVAIGPQAVFQKFVPE